MIYECDQCSAALSPGALACHRCGEKFAQSVPLDATVPKSGFSPVVAPAKMASVQDGRYQAPPVPETSVRGQPPTSSWNQNISGRGLLGAIVLVVIGVIVFGSLSNSGKQQSATGAESPASLPATASSATAAPPSETPASEDKTGGDDSSPSPAPDEPPLSKGSEHFGRESDYDIVTGEITNVGSDRLDNVEAVTTFYDSAGNVVKTEDAIIDFNPLMPGQTSPYKTMGTDNPLIKTEKTEFHTMGGPMIAYSESAGGRKSTGSKNGDTGNDTPGRDPLSAVAGAGSGLSDDPLGRNILKNREVTEGDLKGKSLSALSISYNTIYAVHGYLFKRKSLKNTFSEKSWYHPNPAFSEADLTPMEQANLKTIRDFERTQFGY